MGRFGALDADRLKGKFRFRAIVRKVIINLAWLTEPEEVEEELEEGERLDKAMLRAKSRRRREGGQMLTLEEKLLFNIPPAVRTDEEVQKGLKVIQRMRQFARFPEDVQLGLAKTLYFLYLKANRMILKEGHEAEAMYFVLQGDVLISVERTDPYTHEPVHKHLAILTGGDMFGEVALLYDIPRTASVTSSSVVELLGMNKDDFASVLQRTLEAQWQRFRREIARFSYFDNYGETQIREMCILGRMRSFVKDETILGDGQGTVEYAYFLLSGDCRLIQTITVEVWEEFGDTVYRLLDDPTLVAVRALPGAAGGGGARAGAEEAGAEERGGSASASALALAVAPEQLAAQDEWRLAALRLDAAIGCPAHSPQWRAARSEVQRVLKKEEPFKYKAIVHPEDWDRARHKVIDTLGEHTVRGAKRSRSTEQLHKLFGRSSTGAPPSPAARRMSTLPGISGRRIKLPPFVGRPSDFLGLHDATEDGDAPRARASQPQTYGRHAEAIRSLAGSVVLLRDSSLKGMVGGAAGAEGDRRKGQSGQEPLHLELVRGRRTKGAAAKGRIAQSGSGASLASKGSAHSVKGFATDSERHAVIKMRHEFEDPFERTPRPRRMSLISRGSIRNAWANGVRAVAEVLVRCEEEAAAGAGAEAEAAAAEEREQELRAAWGRACRAVERFMKKEQVPVMRPRHRISCHFVQVCFYTPLQVFGIGECMEQRRVTATSAAECMLLPRYWLDQNNVANVWERVRLYLNRSVPDTRAVFRAWAAERRWLRHRQSVVNDLIDTRRLDSATTPYDVPYSLRLHEIGSPYELGYKRRYVIRPTPATSTTQRKSKAEGKAPKLSKPLFH